MCNCLLPVCLGVEQSLHERDDEMSYDLMVFEKAKAPAAKKEFMAWYEKQTEWSENHDYQTMGVSSPALQNWFMEMKEKFPPMNGEYAPNDDALDDDENLELHMVDYSIGYNVIYAAFSWSVADEAYELMRSLAQKHKVGFFDVSGDDGDIILPDGIMIK